MAVVGVVAVVLTSSFAVPVGSGGGVEPVAFEDTVSLGLTGAVVQQGQEANATVPKVEVFYSGYEYVVGYYGVRSYLAERRRTGHERQFGHPIAVFVTDFAGTNVTLSPEGYLRTASGASPAFVPAEETVVVVGSASETAIPFSDRAAATAFARRYGGQIVPWTAVGDALATGSSLSRERFESLVERRSAWANRTVADARRLRNRPVSVVVGEDEPTLSAAVAAAPPNTTVFLPPGTYRTDGLAVTKPVTIAGAGPETRIRGDGNGSVVTVTAARVGVVDLRIDGVGSVGSAPPANGADPSWSKTIELAYGRGDAAIRLDGADGALVENVGVDTPASGVITRNASGAVLRNLTVRGAASPREGFMGVVAMYAPIVVEDGTFRGGRDAVYTHRADGIVVRDSRMADARYGVHLMYTSGALLRNNVARDESIGIVIMTRPTGNLLVGNRVVDSEVGISGVGSQSYYAENVVVGNGLGIDVSGTLSLYTHNTVVGNAHGLDGSGVLPTNLVTANDVVANGRPVRSRLGPLRVWTVDGAGNYWGPMPSADADADGFYDRPVRPTGPVDGHLHDAVGAWTLARSPALGLARSVQESVPGLRSTGVVDTAPRVRPARPEVLARARANATRYGRTGRDGA